MIGAMLPINAARQAVDKQRKQLSMITSANNACEYSSERTGYKFEPKGASFPSPCRRDFNGEREREREIVDHQHWFHPNDKLN